MNYNSTNNGGDYYGMSESELNHYTAQFVSCIKWSLNANEYIYNQTSKQLTYAEHQITCDSGDFKLEDNGTVAYVCVPKELHPEMGFLDNVCNVYVRAVTVLFLWISIAVRLLITRGFRSASIRPMIFHKLNLSVFYLCMVIRFGPFCGNGGFIPSFVMTIGFYAVRAAYCWLNVISFEMWRTFHPQKLLMNAGSPITSPRRFLSQCLYAWGVPVIMIGGAFLLGTLPLRREQKWRIWWPAYSNIAQLCFMILCLSSIALANVVFCIMVIINLLRLRRDVQQFIHTDDNIERFIVYIKLVVISDVLSFLYYGQMVTLHYTLFSPCWVILDCASNAQGVWLFIIYCCKSSVYKETRRQLDAIYCRVSGSLRKIFTAQVES